MRPSLGSVLLAALIAGLLAGLASGIFHLLATEPVIQRAIDIEETLSRAAGEAAGPEVVSRPVQRIGLIIGFLVYGAAWGLIFGLVYWLLLRLISAQRLPWDVLVLALAGYWTLGIFPHLKYPANPPGVGDPETIGYRQGLYLGFLALSLLGTLLATLVYRGLGGSGQRRFAVRVPLVTLIYLVYAAAIWVLLPDNPDPVRMPMDLVARFRWFSLAGITVFWSALGVTFLVLVGCRDRPSGRPHTRRGFA